MSNTFLDKILQESGDVYDQVFVDIINKSLKQMAINRAKECDAADSMIEMLETTDPLAAQLAVDVIYGFNNKGDGSDDKTLP